MIKNERLQNLIPVLEQLEEGQIDDIYELANACLIVQSVRKTSVIKNKMKYMANGNVEHGTRQKSV